jgi:hypothetical protein
MPFAAKAQKADTVIKSNTIEIIQSYQPEIKQNPKPVLHPNLPPPDTSKPAFKYDVPQQTLFYTYNSTPLRPLALGKDSAFNTYHNYVKIGGGNLSTFYLDFGHEGKGQNSMNQTAEHAVHVHSIYQKGNLKDQQSWLTDAELNGALIDKNKTWHLSMDILRNQYYYYGYDHDMFQYPSSQLSQIFTGLGASLDMADRNASSFHYDPKVAASIYGDNFKTVEKTYSIGIPIFYNIDTSLQLRASLNGTFTEATMGLDHISSNILQFAPGIIYHRNAFNGYIYLDPTIGKDGNYFLPDIAFNYQIPGTALNIGLGWQEQLRQNAFRQLSTENPYIVDRYDIRQTQTSEIFGKADAIIGQHLSLSGRFSVWKYNYLPVFVNTSGDMKQFDILYDTAVNAVSFYAAGRYQLSNTFSAGLSITTVKFSNGDLPKVWHVPGIQAKGDVLIHPSQKWTIMFYVTLLNNIYARDNAGNAVKLNGVFDVGGNVEYNLKSRFSLFVQASNLLNGKNEYFMGYPGYGFNIFGGIRFKF